MKIITSSVDFFVLRREDIKERLNVLTKELEEVKNPCEGNSPLELKRMNLYASDPHFRESVDKYLVLRNEFDSLVLEYDSVSSFIARISNPNFQMLAEGYQKDGSIEATVVERHENVVDIGGTETKMVEGDHNTVNYISSDADMERFFERPIQIGSFAMVVGGSYENAYNIADLYLSDPAVRAKLRNFAFLRGDFYVRIAVSGTPFDYGRLIAAAYPWYTQNPVLNKLFTLGATWDNLKLQYMSQARNSTIIDLKENQPVDIQLPWVSPMPVGRLYNKSTSSISAGTSLDDFTNMWKIYIKTLNTMGSISTSPSPVYVYIYAYMKNVQIGVPTATQLAVTTQSDERKTGPIQKVASNLLNISKSLESAPYIGIYARASSFILGGVKGVASLFGWSAPVIDEKPIRVKNEPYRNGANLIQYDTGKRITLDPKQELAISTEYVSTSEDELTIAHLCAIQSYVTTFTWPATTAPLVNMYNIAIHPAINVPYTGSPSGTKNVLPTPMHMVSQLFTKWHGKIVITLEAVCSAFHRGKLLVNYDPNLYQWSLITANTNLNKQYTHIWDIQETQRYSICVDWNFPRPWANLLPNANSYGVLTGTSLTPNAALAEAVNGFLSIAPLTKLQSPDGSDIKINIYVHGEDMQFNRLSRNNIPTNRSVQYNSGIISESKDSVVSNVESSCIPINPAQVSNSGMANHFYGEQPLSLRGIFKRFCVTKAITTSAAALTDITPAFAYIPIIPDLNPSVGASGVNSLSNAFNHFRPAFLTMRGGLRKRISIFDDGKTSLLPVTISLLQDNNITVSSLTVSGVPLYDTFSTEDGSVRFIRQTNCGIEFEVPFYNNNYFVWSALLDPFDTTVPASDYSSVLRNYGVYTYLGVNASTQNVSIVEETATAEDFQMSYFLGSVPYIT